MASDKRLSLDPETFLQDEENIYSSIKKDQMQNHICEWSSLAIGIYGGQIIFYFRVIDGFWCFLQVIIQACIKKKNKTKQPCMIK